jgi:hypothetical protein
LLIAWWLLVVDPDREGVDLQAPPRAVQKIQGRQSSMVKIGPGNLGKTWRKNES